MADAFDPLLNDAVNFHVQAVDHHRNLAAAESDNVQSLSPEYGHLRRNPISPDFGDQIGSILAIWPKSGQNGRILVKHYKRFTTNKNYNFNFQVRLKAPDCYVWCRRRCHGLVQRP
jgi:hypothetical protein